MESSTPLTAALMFSAGTVFLPLVPFHISDLSLNAIYSEEPSQSLRVPCDSLMMAYTFSSEQSLQLGKTHCSSFYDGLGPVCPLLCEPHESRNLAAFSMAESPVAGAVLSNTCLLNKQQSKRSFLECQQACRGDKDWHIKLFRTTQDNLCIAVSRLLGPHSWGFRNSEKEGNGINYLVKTLLETAHSRGKGREQNK